MTTKTIKTILFASLIAVMVLPFGGMPSIFAEHTGEHGIPNGSHGPPASDATAEKLATLVNTLAFIETELINCVDPSVLAGLEALKVIVLAAIAEITE